MSETASTPNHSANTLLNLIIIHLTPMFLAAANGNLDFARQAATETLSAYRAGTQYDLITVAKIIGFGLAALAALSLSMADDLPITTILRLHASASASDRSEHRNRSALKQNQSRRPVAAPEPDPEPEIDIAALIAAAAEMKQRTAEHLAQLTAATLSKPAPTISEEDRAYQATWAAAAVTFAAETAASLPNLPPEERHSAAIWVQVLNECAMDFMAGDTPPGPTPNSGERNATPRPSGT